MNDDTFDPTPADEVAVDVPRKPPGGPVAASPPVEGAQAMPRVLERALQALGSIPPLPSKSAILVAMLRESGRERLH
jgi:hypothetical protein